MPALDLMRYRYAFIDKDVTEAVQQLNTAFAGKFELVESNDSLTRDAFKLVFLDCEPSEQLQVWRELFDAFYNGDTNAQLLIEVVRHEANSQYDDLKMAFVKRAEKADIPAACMRCKTPAPELTDLKGIYPSFATKVQWFHSEAHQWAMATELRDKNFAGFDPLFDHPENTFYEEPKVEIFDLQCPKCSEEQSKLFDELLSGLN